MMTVDEILDQFEHARPPFPSAAVADAIVVREAITPRLLQILENVAADPSPYIADEDRFEHIFALFLLAKFRDARAFPVVRRIVSLPGETVRELLGDVITESLGSILASIGAENDLGIRSLIEDESVDEFVRDAALHALVTSVGTGRHAREEVMAYLKGLFARLPRTKNFVWTGLSLTCLDLCPIEVRDEMEAALEQGLTDSLSFGRDDIEQTLAAGIDGALAQLPMHGYRLIDDVRREMSWMSAFQPKEPVESIAPYEDPSRSLGHGYPETFVRESPKVGRNDPCPCGSGKKYKKCCGD